jgi:hypothetical protein
VSSPSRNRKLSLTAYELELLHAGPGVLIAHYTAAEETAIARCLALRVSRQLLLITAPLLSHAVCIDLPGAANELTSEKPETVTLAIDAEGKLYWNDELLAETELPVRLEEGGWTHPAAGAVPTRGQDHDLPARGRGDVRGAAHWDHKTWVCDGTRPTVREGQSAMLPML